MPDEGSFSLFAYEQAHISINYNDVLTNGVAGAAELQILVYDKNDSLNYNEILTFRNSVCVENSLSNLIIPPTQTNFCEGEMITLESIEGLQNIAWSTGATTPSITIPVAETITLSAEDENGCPQFEELNFEIAYPYNESVCIVSVDEATGKNVIVWEKTDDQQTVAYNIYKETQAANQYELIGTQTYEKLSIFVDEIANPNEGSNRYKISTVNDCGGESDLSPEHKTMHLTVNTSNNGDINLIWEKYEGFEYPTFNILRGATTANMQLIAQRPSNTFTFTDIAPPSGDLFYQIEIVTTGDCEPTKDYNATRSNIANNNVVSTTTLFSEQGIHIFPNPFTDALQIEDMPSDVKQLNLKDAAGRVLIQKTVQTTDLTLDVPDLPAGMYFVELIGERVYISKVVK